MSAPNSSTDYYEVLQVSPTASPEVIEAAYQGLMRKYGADADPAVRELRQHVEIATLDLAHRRVLLPPDREFLRLGDELDLLFARDRIHAAGRERGAGECDCKTLFHGAPSRGTMPA